MAQGTLSVAMLGTSHFVNFFLDNDFFGQSWVSLPFVREAGDESEAPSVSEESGME